MKLIVKRVYDKFSKEDGFRVLVDRLWPRGVSKEKAKIDMWAKEVAPSGELRSWFHEDKENRFKDFSKRYEMELKKNNALASLKKELKGKKIATLVTAVKDMEASHIPLLKRYLNM